MQQATLIHQGGMHFVCQNRDLVSTMDATLDHGGQNLGPTPKELILNAMMGCTAMDVLALLNKMRQEYSAFSMTIEADKNSDHPIYFKSAILSFIFTGAVDPEKLLKAINLSLTKYCGVNYMMSKTCHISFKAYINDELVGVGGANFIDPQN